MEHFLDHLILLSWAPHLLPISRVIYIETFQTCGNTLTASLIPVLHTTLPLGTVNVKEGRMRHEEDRDVWRRCLDCAIIPAVRLCVCVCVDLCVLPVGLHTCPKLSAILLICVFAGMHFDSDLILPGKCLSRDQQHVFTLLWMCQNVVSCKQSDDIPSVIQTAC